MGAFKSVEPMLAIPRPHLYSVMWCDRHSLCNIILQAMHRTQKPFAMMQCCTVLFGGKTVE